ncbi:hypothetical protein AA313_de0202263 [Arthrobotrys entomopaga]|nr:hypothetical protein AA313_de0202263 [Arthrobotrys entomopaga]
MGVQKQTAGTAAREPRFSNQEHEAIRETPDEDMFDELSFYDVNNSRRNTQLSTTTSSSRTSATSYSDSIIQRQAELRRGSVPTLPSKISEEEEFYTSVNTNLSTNQLAQFTPDTGTPLSAESGWPESLSKPRAASVDARSINAYPTPTSASRKPKELALSESTHRFPDWYNDGAVVSPNRENGAASAKQSRAVSDSGRDDEIFWGDLYNGNGQWSSMWFRLLDGIYDYYYRFKCPGKQGLDPQTLGQVWEEMGYTVEDNLYESQIRLAQSLFHPDPEDFISSLLTNYFSLLDLPHFLEQPPVQPPPSFLPKCVNPEPPVAIPLLDREGFRRYFIHQTLLDPGLMHERFNTLMKLRGSLIIDPETGLKFGKKGIPRQSFGVQGDPMVEEVEERVRGWMRNWVKGEVDGWVGAGGGGGSGPHNGMGEQK